MFFHATMFGIQPRYGDQLAENVGVISQRAIKSVEYFWSITKDWLINCGTSSNATLITSVHTI